MEYFNTDAAEAIYKHIKRNEVESLLKDMLLILKKQIIVHKLYCSDIKSENYVVNVDKHGKVTKVRMIDFGERFCIKKIFEKNKEVKQETRQILFYILMGIQLVLSTNVDNKTMLNVLKADKYIKNIKKYKKELLDVVYNIQVSSLFHYLRTYSHSLIYALESVMTDTFEKDIPDLNIVNKNKEVTLSKIYSNLEQKCAHARFDIAYNLYMAFNKLIELGGQKYSDEYYLYQLYIELFPNKRDSTVSFKKLNTEPFDEARFAATNIPPKLLETVRKLRTPLYLKTCYNLLHGTKSLYGKSAERVYRTIVKQVDNSKYINNRHLALYIIKRIDDYNSKEFHKIANFMGINMKEYKNPV